MFLASSLHGVTSFYFSGGGDYISAAFKKWPINPQRFYEDLRLLWNTNMKSSLLNASTGYDDQKCQKLVRLSYDIGSPQLNDDAAISHLAVIGLSLFKNNKN